MARPLQDQSWKKKVGGALILAFLAVPLMLSYAWSIRAGLLFAAGVAGTVVIFGNIFGNAATKSGIKADGLGFWLGGLIFAVLMLPSLIGAGAGMIAETAE